MNHMPLLEHLKVLKAAMPQAQKQQPSADHKLPIFKNLKSAKSTPFNQGIFQNMSFCVPFIDPQHDPPADKITQIVRGIFVQGGIIIEYHQRMIPNTVKFLIVSSESNIESIRRTMHGVLKFEKMLKYQYILDSLKRLKKMNPEEYLLFDNNNNLNTEQNSEALAKEKLMAQKIHQMLIRPPLQIAEGKTQTENEQQDNLALPQGDKSTTDIYQKDSQCPSKIDDKISNAVEIKPSIDQKPSQRPPVSPFQKESILKKEKKKQQQKQKEQSKKEQVDEFPWQNKADRRVIWYQPPKNLASHSFANNNFICQKFMELQQIYKRHNDIRNFSYIRAVAIIKNHNKEIRTIEDLKDIKGLTSAMVQKIKELLETGTMSKLNIYTNKEENVVCKQLEKVWGIGPKKAKQFFDQGIKTVDDLRKRPQLITSKNMAIGLKYFDQFAKRIPREKVTRIYQYIKKLFFELVRSDRMHQIEIVGSYRRQRPTCGDIDVLICRHDGYVEPTLLKNFIEQLQSKKFITESLSQPRLFDGRNNSAYMGVCFFEEQHHRIDIKHYPVDQYAFALMYFTGSDLFNRQMRMKAHNRGLLLSDHGLKSKERNGINKIWKGGSIPILKTQQEIFSFLQLDYCQPKLREI